MVVTPEAMAREAMAREVVAQSETLCGRDGRSMARLMADLMREARGQPLFEDPSFVSFRDEGSGAVFVFTKIGQAAHPAVICRGPAGGEAAPARVQTVCTAPQEACETLVEQIRSMP
jgi:hypothetical protein